MHIYETDQVMIYSDRDIEYVEWLLCSAAVTSDSPKSLVLMIVFSHLSYENDFRSKHLQYQIVSLYINTSV